MFMQGRLNCWLKTTDKNFLGQGSKEYKEHTVIQLQEIVLDVKILHKTCGTVAERIHYFITQFG